MRLSPARRAPPPRGPPSGAPGLREAGGHLRRRGPGSRASLPTETRRGPAGRPRARPRQPPRALGRRRPSPARRPRAPPAAAPLPAPRAAAALLTWRRLSPPDALPPPVATGEWGQVRPPRPARSVPTAAGPRPLFIKLFCLVVRPVTRRRTHAADWLAPRADAAPHPQLIIKARAEPPVEGRGRGSERTAIGRSGRGGAQRGPPLRLRRLRRLRPPSPAPCPLPSASALRPPSAVSQPLRDCRVPGTHRESESPRSGPVLCCIAGRGVFLSRVGAPEEAAPQLPSVSGGIRGSPCAPRAPHLCRRRARALGPESGLGKGGQTAGARARVGPPRGALPRTGSVSPRSGSGRRSPRAGPVVGRRVTVRMRPEGAAGRASV